MDASMITRYTHVPTPRQRLNDYYEKLDAALSAGHGVSCEVVNQFVDVNKMVANPNNISRFLRKGGAK